MAPVLEITDGRGNLLPFAVFTVLATMLHPDDPEARERLAESLVANLVIETAKSLPRKLWRLVTERARHGDSLIDHAAAGYGMAVAGDLLMMVASAAGYCPEHASLARAVRVWCADQAKGRTHNGRKVAASPRKVMDAWARFKPVAHLAAAFRLHMDLGEQSEFDQGDPKKLPNFLAAAEAFRIFGEGHHPPVGRFMSRPSNSTTLDPATTWRMPADLQLPSVYLWVPPPTAFAEKIYREYRAD